VSESQSIEENNSVRVLHVPANKLSTIKAGAGTLSKFGGGISDANFLRCSSAGPRISRHFLAPSINERETGKQISAQPETKSNIFMPYVNLLHDERTRHCIQRDDIYGTGGIF